jgi:hypothetical protein
MTQLMRELIQWEHRTLLSLKHGDDAMLVLGQRDVRASVELWRNCVDITDLLKVAQASAAAGGRESSGITARGDGAAAAGVQPRTAGAIMQVTM